MDIEKLYIIQSIVNAANNLRLNTERIEIITLLREHIQASSDVGTDISEMKKITELSTLAIRLGEIHNFISKGKIDFLRLSDRFKEHSSTLVRDLNYLFDRITPPTLRDILENLKQRIKNGEITESDTISIDPSAYSKTQFEFEKQPLKNSVSQQEIKEKLIMEEPAQTEDFVFQNFEEKILSLVRDVDGYLKVLATGSIKSEEIQYRVEMLKKNGEMSKKAGFEIIANMHSYVTKALLLICGGVLLPERGVIESIRACLIVTVAVVRGKDVDITAYLNRAERFGREIINKN